MGWGSRFFLVRGFPLHFQVHNIPNIDKFGAAKRPNIKIQGSEGSEGGGSTGANSPEMIYVYAILSLPTFGGCRKTTLEDGTSSMALTGKLNVPACCKGNRRCDSNSDINRAQIKRFESGF